MASQHITEATVSTFKNTLESTELPVLVDFWAPWCGPCRTLAPMLEELAEKYDGQVKVVKVNVQEQRALGAEHGVRSIPTLAVFHKGQKLAQQAGFGGRAHLEAVFADLAAA